MARMHDKKSHDYASNSDPFGNYLFSGELATLFMHSPEDIGFITRIAEKLYRLSNLEKSGKSPQNESIADTETDIAVITCLWMAARRHLRKRAAQMQEIERMKGQERYRMDVRGEYDGPVQPTNPANFIGGAAGGGKVAGSLIPPDQDYRMRIIELSAGLTDAGVAEAADFFQSLLKNRAARNGITPSRPSERSESKDYQGRR